MDVDSEIEALFGLPLADFTAARDRLARKLKDDGATEEAARVRGLRRPKVSVWAVNQLARRERPTVEKLLRLFEDLRSEDPSAVRGALATRRDVVADLTDAAERILIDSGHSASPETLRQVSQMLLAGGSDEERKRLLRGTLTEELSPSGLDALGASLRSTEPAEAERRDRRGRERARQLAAEADDAQREARRLRIAADNARRAADAAEKEARLAAKRADAARDRAEKAQRTSK